MSRVEFRELSTGGIQCRESPQAGPGSESGHGMTDFPEVVHRQDRALGVAQGRSRLRELSTGGRGLLMGEVGRV
ncbi:hypothetical protein GCM10022226_04380 [Sphaerisporangium flaviroseum]|uniref:Uncharacterized protein n=1 Tax=Sphaerisporangium flaviroseum TaxID=509199 RepID=A0ABP7HCV8_9ACTN